MIQTKKIKENIKDDNPKVYYHSVKLLLAIVEEMSLDVFRIKIYKTTIEPKTFYNLNKIPEYPQYTATLELDKTKKDIFLKGFQECLENQKDDDDDVYYLGNPNIPFFAP